MTYKHVNFQDSPTMRSLEKVALDKGLASPDVINKTASAEAPDYTPSENLMENVIKLCSGLRENGFEKHANELEGKFIDYKRAFNAYETSKETGEDLIDEAHPEGSHDLEGVEGDATIETIIDQHLKDVKMIEKSPTGKLASVKDIIGAVKKVIAQDSNIIRKNLNALKNNLSSIMRIYHEENVLSRPLSFAGGDLLNLVNSYDEKNININAAREIQTALNDLKNVYKPGFVGFGGIAADAWKKMVPYFDSAVYEANEIIKELTSPASQGKPLPGSAGPQEVTNGFKERVVATTSKIKALSRAVERNNKPNLVRYKGQANKWLEDKLAQINKLVTDFNEDLKTPSLNKDEVVKNYLQELSTITDKPGESLDDFKGTWG